ncbi:Tetratricopeptide repeat (TPR)-like superfamily protein [Abeliophyllum distichum]|uniref:Tetratricopeptide repeat (TPR)-like superfamily protein n=1 Tax=Abeliophyllum distichum TaxID=126358 RepID=A0ABD1P7K4_9LAMI
MKKISYNSIIRSTAPVIRIRSLLSVFSHNFVSAAASTSPCGPLIEDSESEENKDSYQVSGVIQDKDLLRKTHNGNILVLDLIDGGAMEPDARLYNQLLKRCTELGKLKEGQMIHSHFFNSKFNHYAVTYNTLINMYAKCDELDLARKVFDEMPERDMVSYTVLITGYSQNNESQKALELFLEMVRMGLRPNQFTFGSVLKAAGSLQNEGMGRGIHGMCVKYRYEENVYVGSALVDMYARCGQMEEAQAMFDRLERKNEVSWNAVIAAYARKGEGENAVRLFSDMKRDGFEPTHFTYSSVFVACASTGALEQGKWVHADMVKSGLKLMAFVGNTLLDMYGKAGNIEDAKRVFDRLAKRDLVSWNSMLTAYAQHGLGKETIECFEDLRRMGFQPNEVSFLCVLNACSHAGILDKGLYYFELMKKFKIEPEVSHYVTIVDLLGRAGQLDRAVRFIQEMTIEPTAAVWKALLGACRMHKNMELGAYAAEHVFELDPYDSGPHVLLCNIYASAGRWSNAAEVRKMMNESGVKKEPACSWVELENAVHIFVANDITHPQREEIRRMWEKTADKIKKIGYVPDTTHVLWGANQEEREERLQKHSEKLALAFALLNTPPGSPIRIKKNIRVCGDCHTAFKFVSVVENREIILRDTNRFHHFRGGYCSCGDYW